MAHMMAAFLEEAEGIELDEVVQAAEAAARAEEEEKEKAEKEAAVLLTIPHSTPVENTGKLLITACNDWENMTGKAAAGLDEPHEIALEHPVAATFRYCVCCVCRVCALCMSCVSPNLISSHPALPCPALSCPALPCPAAPPLPCTASCCWPTGSSWPWGATTKASAAAASSPAKAKGRERREGRLGGTCSPYPRPWRCQRRCRCCS